MRGVGGYGDYWLSTIPSGSTDAQSLLFNTGGFNPNNHNTRSYGYQTRCLQE
ncbi:MAG: hypothetical protein K2G93_07915 [Rikenella sp.]|nr:hypothetical protein [Rikenella sp.]